jgi:hypothetical protein
VVNFALEATALNINRIGAALRRLPSGLLEGLPKMNMQAAMAGRCAPGFSLGGGGLGARLAGPFRQHWALGAAPHRAGHSAGRDCVPA